MQMNYNTETIKERMEKARTRYRESLGMEWNGIVLWLLTLAEAYRKEGKIDMALNCEKEADTILGEAERNTWKPVPEPGCTESFLCFSEEIDPLVEQMDQSRKDMKETGDPIAFAYSVDCLCESFPKSERAKMMALVNCREAYMHYLQMTMAGRYDDRAARDAIFDRLLLKAAGYCCTLGEYKDAVGYLTELVRSLVEKDRSMYPAERNYFIKLANDVKSSL